jgi:large subunit ribosomal protein L16
MLVSPRKFKYKKSQKGTIPNKLPSKQQPLRYGTFAIKSLSFGILTSNQIEAARKLISKKLKKKGKVWITVFTHTPKTKKPVEIRMGKGKGSVDVWISKVRPGTILYEIEGASIANAKEIFFEANQKLPIKCKLCY